MNNDQSLRKYSTADARRIIRGLASGLRPGHVPMTDAEFLRRNDPERYRHEQLLDLEERLIDAMEQLVDHEQPMRQNQPKPAPPVSTTPQTGAIDL